MSQQCRRVRGCSPGCRRTRASAARAASRWPAEIASRAAAEEGAGHAFASRRGIAAPAAPVPCGGPGAELGQDALLDVAPAGLGGMIAVEQEDLVEIEQVVMLGQPEPEIVVLGLPEGGAVAADGEHGVAPHQHGGMGDAVGLRQRRADRRRAAGKPADLPPPPAGIDDLDEAADDCDRGPRRQHRDLPLEASRQGDVVGIHAGDVAAGGGGDRLVQGRHQAAAGRRQKADARVGGGLSGEQGRRCVDRAVVDDDELEIREALAADAGDGLMEEGGAVAHRQDDADQRGRHRARLSPAAGGHGVQPG